MKEQLINLFSQYPYGALIISIAASIIVAVVGLVPSVFITAANILFFGFWKGTLISFAGEVLGAAVAFFLYRSVFKKRSRKSLENFPKLRRLIEAEGGEAFLLILSLRLIPFIPSGLVTFAAAIGRISVLVFLTASSLGKIPALFIEAYTVYQVSEFGPQGKVLLVVIALLLLFFVLRRRK